MLKMCVVGASKFRKENIQRVLFVQYIKFQENVPGCGGTTNAPLCPP